MRILNSLLAFAIAISIPLTSRAFTNEPSGFRGIAWGTKYSDSLGLKVTERSGNTWLAEKPDERMTIGAAELSQVSYVFENETFKAAVVVTNNQSNNQAMLDALESQYGTPDRPNRFMDKYFWVGKVTTISMRCETSLAGQCATYFTSALQMKKDSDDRAKKARDAANDF